MRMIYYWADGTWCEAEDLFFMTHMSDDFASIEVSGQLTDNEVDDVVTQANTR